MKVQKKPKEILPQEGVRIRRDSAKELAAEELRNRGYNACVQDGIVICNDLPFSELKQMLAGMGYGCSFGTAYAAKKRTESEEFMGEREKDPRLQELSDKGVPVYSFSRLECINNCLYAAYRTYVLKEKGHGNVYNSAGSVVHQILEDITNGKATEKDLLPGIKEELSNLELLGIEWPKDRNGEDGIRANWINDMTHFCRTYSAPKNKDLKTEELFIYRTPDGHYLQGYIDLQMKNKDGSISLFDYKTSTMYSASEMKAHARQLILYALGKEQEGRAVKSASFIFLKYATVTFMGRKTKKSKEKTKMVKHIERRKIGKELQGYVYADLLERGYDDLDAQITLDKFTKDNMISSLPEEVRDSYVMKPCVIPVDLSDESKAETVAYIQEAIALWESLDTGNESNYPPRKFTKTKTDGQETKDTFFCHQLCDHGSVCRYLKDFDDTWQEQDSEEDIF